MRDEVSAFDLWLYRDLARTFGSVVNEKLSDELLALLPERD